MKLEIVSAVILKIMITLLLIISNFNCHKNSSIIYILVWTGDAPEPFGYLEWGQDAFIKRNCTFQNCYLSYDPLYFDDLLDFDALMFNTVQTHYGYDFPPFRSESQEYILVGMEPASYYRIDERYNGFFNMTWTYKLNSDVPLPYVIIENKTTGEEIGPRKKMKWMNISSMAPTDEEIIGKLRNKSKAGVMMASNCFSRDRLLFVHNLNMALQKYNLYVDIIGKCGKQLCPRFNDIVCHQVIQKNYYFYLVFENSFSDDYVSEKLLHAIKSYAVPIVYGGADYTRFMPDGMYLNAYELGVEKLAQQMNDIINDTQRYYDFFRWHRYYRILKSGERKHASSVCGMCALLNNQTRREQRTYYRNIAKWWQQEGADKKQPLRFEEDEKVEEGFFKKLYNFFFS